MKHLEGRVAVITGAASGIGLAMAQRFARAGMQLMLADIEAQALEGVVSEFTRTGVRAAGMRVDVGVEAEVKALADRAWSEFGAVHVVCNNAGVASPALRTRPWESTIADWQWILQVNLMGVLHGVRAFVPRMLEEGNEGHIVNTASMAGLLTSANPYHVSKHGVACLTEGLYKELKAMGSRISASVVCPGLIKTAILEAERNRPEALGRTDIDALPSEVQRWASGFRKSLEGGYDPSEVADQVHDAILADRYWVLPAQPHLLDLVRLRMEDILAQRNPTLPPGT